MRAKFLIHSDVTRRTYNRDGAIGLIADRGTQCPGAQPRRAVILAGWVRQKLNNLRLKLLGRQIQRNVHCRHDVETRKTLLGLTQAQDEAHAGSLHRIVDQSKMWPLSVPSATT